MSERRWFAALFLLFAALFWIANRGAYKGYFSDDDLDNLANTRELDLIDFATPLVIPRVFANNFRPVGHFFYKAMGTVGAMKYDRYVTCIQLLHFVNVFLLWNVLRRLGLGRWAAAVGVLFWAFHMALFDVYWKPMYVFDLLCGLFCLAAVLTYLKGHWVRSLIAMWLAYRSKEVAIMLPVVLLGYEYLLGQRRWKQLIPFFALSLLIGVQALSHNRTVANAYMLKADPVSLIACVEFYAGKVFLLPWAGLLILILPLLTKDRRVWFGVGSTCVLLVPMLLLPGRLFSAYLYVPMIGSAIAMAALAQRRVVPAALLIVLLWVPWNYTNLRWNRSIALSDVPERRAYIRSLNDFSRTNPEIRAFVAGPGPMQGYAQRAVLKLARPPAVPIRFATLDDPDFQTVFSQPQFVILRWNAQTRSLLPLVKLDGTPDASFITMGPGAPIWQLTHGWHGIEGAFCWTQPVAEATLLRSPNVRKFRLTVNVGEQLLAVVKHSHVWVKLNGAPIGDYDFTRNGWQTVEWPLPPSAAGTVNVQLHTEPAYPGADPLGIAVGAFGFTQ